MRERQDRFMSKQWSNSNAVQLELLEAEPGTLSDAQVPEDHRPARQVSAAPAPRSSARTARSNDGHPLVVALAQLYEDPNNPRTECPESEIRELADDIRRSCRSKNAQPQKSDPSPAYSVARL